ncbi:hypothetical protein F4821DRAFT_7148 [Hypoxylon rubiginosum]|uniref:Uncharacterized protein n=1 Tax=Hypoxylon rubiginosum TaxID=110542 RepID=A0ACC0DMI7_9PEZI|nr:hypothetical protein F4821DRAFT_7148 [Hypoxylon rubiginosum]
MQVATLFASAMAFAGMAAAVGNALITVEASHGGAGNGLTNTTMSVPIGVIYTHNPAMEEVSTLYLVGSTSGVPVDSIVCTPYKSTDGTGSHGLPFTSKVPSYLSTNTVVVGSIVCEA